MQGNQDKLIEDKIINDFIDDMVPMWEPDAINDNPRYNDLGVDETGLQDLEAFKFFNNEYEKASLENPKIDSIGFDRFVKLFRPERTFNEELRNFKNEATGPSKTWRDMYGSDTNLYKQSAYKGYQRALAMAAKDSKSDPSLNG